MLKIYSQIKTLLPTLNKLSAVTPTRYFSKIPKSDLPTPEPELESPTLKTIQELSSDVQKIDDRDLERDDPSKTYRPEEAKPIEDQLRMFDEYAYKHMKKSVPEGFKVDIQPRNPDGSLKYDKKTQLMMDNYHLLKDKQVYDEKLLGRPKGVLDFSDKTLSEKSPLNIDDASENGFTVNGVTYAGSLVLFPNQVFSWDVYNTADIRAHCFDMLEYMKPSISNFLDKKNRIHCHWNWKRRWELGPTYVRTPPRVRNKS
jgi:hypothetical protein